MAKEKVSGEKLSHLLEKAYGRPIYLKKDRKPPLDQLVHTVLSQNTTDGNRDLAFSSLKSRFPAWEDVYRAKGSDLSKCIRSGGLANQKARNIKKILNIQMRRHGTLDMNFLYNLPSKEAEDYLLRLPGVGLKTARCVILFSLGLPAFPVDTHILRVTKRLGFIDRRTGTDKAHLILEKVFHPDLYYSVHLNLIRHGREVCKARAPHCNKCVLYSICLCNNIYVKQ